MLAKGGPGDIRSLPNYWHNVTSFINLTVQVGKIEMFAEKLPKGVVEVMDDFSTTTTLTPYVKPSAPTTAGSRSG